MANALDCVNQMANFKRHKKYEDWRWSNNIDKIISHTAAVFVGVGTGAIRFTLKFFAIKTWYHH